ncbi:MAG TPA: hypothetical protein DEG17_17100 [Cyanobacteria bacterium UBA11149]|nr:hypothetical protein [Cyanobacteria bacterium UBA11367]HBE58036.1 hypothetical protein [Cyanobacteria bacterium UBA11366]HBK66259.1 hypothetical protein [Cyanobacteria bacterium UBA11166]HBR75337.1 hypothetical protein [Cyanobacteria bacterium UBA11159]HBS71948.1 hypothetical protein [Cyanobacteria bacterium UBA11153]HBW90540.1 hypothetical protein [Cyanobacteria bacterium UBA11149]HCA93929.1 hypothetical protein [Cyanobacteria bacterium UBA9226]
MLNQIRLIVNQFFRRSSTIENEPLNKLSLIVIILIDIFILVNVFSGLDDISRWHIDPYQAYPCYSEWDNYQKDSNKDKDYEILRLSLPSNTVNPTNFRQTYQQVEIGHLGKVSQTCLTYGEYKDKINNSENQNTIKIIDRKNIEISKLEQNNQTIRSQYNSTLLEKIAGQPRNRSINQVGAEKAKEQLQQNSSKIATLKQEITNLKTELFAKPESINFFTFLKNSDKFSDIEKGHKEASFWYPSIQLAFQCLFLFPLILITLSIHNLAQRKRYGLISLMSWHLLVIFLIPLILKTFKFLQVGAIFQFLFDIISTIFGGLLFLISYAYILLIPLIGFGIIKFFQKAVFNTKIQAASRVQKSRCIKCAKKIKHHDTYCPHCGYYQYLECRNCHNFTYKHLPYCRECGHPQEGSNL